VKFQIRESLYYDQHGTETEKPSGIDVLYTISLGGGTHTFQKKGEEKGERKRKFKLLEGTQNGKISFLSAPPAA
jgi:alkaline phosphatase